ncbi:MAG TPA: hypothetical protein ENH65_10425 [Candidatus Aminicenantes bacterium]|nr:hypothetical protein [Candidatus Aminicenantes bacterium]
MPKENDKGKESFEITEETEDKEDDVKSDGEEEMNDERADLKSKIKDNLKRAIEFQTEIKELTAKTLEGLEKMDDLSKMLEELYHKAEEKVESLEKDLEGKTTVPEGEKSEEEGVNFEHLLSKAKEIKEMLRKPGEIEPGGLEEEKEEKVEEEGAPEEEISPLEAADETAKGEAEEDAEIEPLSEEKEEPGIEEAPEEDISLLEAMDKTIKMKAGEEVEMEPVPEEKEEPGIEEAQEEDAPDGDEEEISPLEALDATIKIKPMEKLKKKAAQEEKRGAGGEEDEVSGFPKRRASDALEILEKYKKAEPEEEAEVVYYENGDKKILDSECIVSAVCSRLEEAEKLYKKLSKTESPIDQFFVKQEIIRSQEALRGVILAGTRMLEKESSVLPEYTIGVMNINVLKEILEKLSMQNWSKKTDFGLFTEYAAKLKKDYYARISSLVDYLKSLIEELGLEF